jgi:phosphoribosyl-AMP cyclohydrolase
MKFTEEKAKEIIKNIDFEKMGGIIPVVIQDYENNEILMVAFENRESLIETLRTGFTHFFSRTKSKLWKKGEKSGHLQKILGIYLDCDSDSLVIKVDQYIAACHKGFRTCFYRELKENAEWRIIKNKIFNPKQIY